MLQYYNGAPTDSATWMRTKFEGAVFYSVDDFVDRYIAARVRSTEYDMSDIWKDVLRVHARSFFRYLTRVENVRVFDFTSPEGRILKEGFELNLDQFEIDHHRLIG